MTETDRIREEILAALTAIAPEIEADKVDERAPLRQQVEAAAHPGRPRGLRRATDRGLTRLTT